MPIDIFRIIFVSLFLEKKNIFHSFKTVIWSGHCTAGQLHRRPSYLAPNADPSRPIKIAS